MSRKSSALANLDIDEEALHQQDGLAERVARARGQKPAGSHSDAGAETVRPSGTKTHPDEVVARRARDPNRWRAGKAMLQVAISDDTHVELAILAKRRRRAVSDIVREAMNDWLEKHGHSLRLSD